MSRIPLLLGSLLPALAATLLAQDMPQVAGNPPGRVARLSYLSGNVAFLASGDTAWSTATLNYPVTAGDRVYADRGARAELQVGPFAVRLSEATDLLITNLNDQLMQLGFTQGTLRVSVYQLAPGDSVEVDTPHGALALLAPGEYRLDAPADGRVMVVTVARGTLEWTAGGVAQLVQGGQAIRLAGVNPIQVASVRTPAPDAFDQWSDSRDHRFASSASMQYVSRDIPGYDELDDAGRWEVDVSYGPMWYPTLVPVGWVPYRYGHWVWVEPWGWTWVEHARWGYAPFHYGRWAYLRGRWGWLPGPVAVRPYYAPALVVFDDPLQLAGRRVQALGDRGQRHVEDGVVEADQEQGDAEDGQRDPAPAVARASGRYPSGQRHLGHDATSAARALSGSLRCYATEGAIQRAR